MNELKLKTLNIANREDWRKWLESNHSQQTEVWLIYYKKHTKKLTISYNDAVEEALCFGWIDSTAKRIDDEKYMQRFTPRKDVNNWSELNISRVHKLIKEGKMTEIGLSKTGNILNKQSIEMFNDSNQNQNQNQSQNQQVELSTNLIEQIKRNKQAWDYFNKLAPSHKRNYINWIMSAKRETTRSNRVKEAIELLAKNQKLGMK